MTRRFDLRFKKGVRCGTLIMIFAVLIGFAQNCSNGGLEKYLEVEFKRIEETYNLMEKFSEEIWPGWDNWMEIQFGVQFPNLVFLLANPIEEVPEGYVKLEGRTIRGKNIYLNRMDELPIKLEPPLSGGGGGGYKISIRLRAMGDIDESQISEEHLAQMASENQVLLYVHEYFHGFQQKVLPWMQRSKKRKDKKGEKEKEEEKEKKRPKRPKNWRPPRFEVNTEYAAYKEIAGMALMKASNETDDAKAREFLKDYIVAREIQLASMPEMFSRQESRTQVSEGTATYSNTKMAMLACRDSYVPAISKKNDPYFFGYKYMDNYIKRYMKTSIKACLDRTLDTLGHSYTFGMYQCFLLDRFLPGWKEGFFQNEKTMDGVMQKCFNLNEEEKRTIIEGFKEKFGFDKIYARHAAVIKERDDAIALIEGRRGRTYIVDFEPTREFFNSKARGKEVVLGVRHIFLNGIEELTLGDVKLVSKDIPMERDWLWTVRWVDTAPKEGETGYTITNESIEGDVFKNASITTGGFTLKVPEVKIEETEGEVRFIILSKVMR